MATLLKDLFLDEISLVDSPANKSAKVTIFKAAAMTCPDCGAGIGPDQKVCKSCGYKVAKAAAPPRPPPDDDPGNAPGDGPGDDPYEDDDENGDDEMSDATLDQLAKGLEDAELKITELVAKTTALSAENTRLTEDLEAARAGGDVQKTEEEDIMKGLPDGVRARFLENERIAKAAETEIAKMRDERETAVYVAKAGVLKSISGNAGDIGALLFRVAKGRTTEADATELERVLKAADAAVTQGGVFKEIGKVGPGSPAGSAEAELQAAAAQIVKSNPGMSEAVAFTKACQANPMLYDRHVAETRSRIAKAV